MLPCAVIVIVFSTSNRVVTNVDIWPFDYVIELPVFGVVLSSILIGFIFGSIFSWLWFTLRR